MSNQNSFFFAQLQDLQHMGYNIDESRFVDNLNELSKNIRNTKQFLEESKEKIDRIYKRIQQHTT